MPRFFGGYKRGLFESEEFLDDLNFTDPALVVAIQVSRGACAALVDAPVAPPLAMTPKTDPVVVP
jgi:hypothetical protein